MDDGLEEDDAVDVYNGQKNDIWVENGREQQ